MGYRETQKLVFVSHIHIKSAGCTQLCGGKPWHRLQIITGRILWISFSEIKTTGTESVLQFLELTVYWCHMNTRTRSVHGWINITSTRSPTRWPDFRQTTRCADTHEKKKGTVCAHHSANSIFITLFKNIHNLRRAEGDCHLAPDRQTASH